MRTHGTAPGLLAAILLSIGAYPAGAQASGLAIEYQLARELGISLGDTVSLGPAVDSMTRLAVIVAIYEPKPDPAEVAQRDRHIRLHLADLAGILGAPDRVDRFGLGLGRGTSPDSAAADLNRMAFGYRAHSASAIASESSQTFLVVSR